MAIGENHVKTDRLLWVVPMFLLLASGEVFAQSSVDARVQKLEDTIRVLERRVSSLEDQLREKHVPARVASDKLNWRKLEKGMSEAEVEQLLGSPTKVDMYGVYFVWSYDRGEVRFDGSTSTVTGWHEP